MDNILYVLERADKFVYHYTKPESLAEHVLPTEHIRFSRFTRTNDPRECKDWKLGLWISVARSHPYGPENPGRAALIESAFSRFEAYNAMKTAKTRDGAGAVSPYNFHYS